MIGSWWIYGLLLIFIGLLLSVGYGWGYRGWGPPFPRHIQRRRARRAAAAATHHSHVFSHESWGWVGDGVWIMLVVFGCWAVGAFIWWR